jgi:hypothetical protein
MIVMQMDNDEDRETIIVIIIEPENLHRMEQADPITLQSGAERGGFLKTITFPDKLRMIIGYEAEPGRFYEMLQQGRTADMLRDLMRGYQFTEIDGKRSGGKEFKRA